MAGREGQESGTKGMHITDALFQQVAEKLTMTLESWKNIDLSSSTSMVATQSKDWLESHQEKLLSGNYAFELTGMSICSQLPVVRKVVLRAKKPGSVFISIACKLQREADPDRADQLEKVLAIFGESEKRDIFIAEAAMDGSWFQCMMPEVYLTKMDEENGIYFFVMEYLDTERFSHINCIEGGPGFSRDQWYESDIRACLRDLARFHAQYIGSLHKLPDSVRSVLFDGPELFGRLFRYIQLTSEDLGQQHPDIWTPSVVELNHRIAYNIHFITQEFLKYPKTFVHNDLNPKNICLRRIPAKGGMTMCVYDWEISHSRSPTGRHRISCFHTSRRHKTRRSVGIRRVLP